MKKLAALTLSVLMILSIVGCAPADMNPTENTQQNQEAVLQVGFGEADVTPTEPVPLDGLSDPLGRISEDIRDRLYVTCVAFTDGAGNTIIHFTTDLLQPYVATIWGRADVSKETGVPVSNIMIGSTHSHSAPALSLDDQPSVQNYNELIREKMVEAAVAAMADRKPSKMYITTVYPENINFIRHYVLQDGSYAGDNFGAFKSANPPVRHVREVDNALQLVKFIRDGAKDIIMMNWQGHPTGHTENRYSVLSYSTRVTDTVEQGLDCHCIYVLGASGNVNNSTRIASEKIYKTYEETAAALGSYVVEATDYKEVQVGNVQILGQDCDCTASGGASRTMKLHAYSIGDVAFVTAPYEMFSENGQAVKAASPFAMTFVSSCTNGRDRYIPSISTYDYQEYNVYEIRSCEFAQGTAEVLENYMISMLKEIYKTK